MMVLFLKYGDEIYVFFYKMSLSKKKIPEGIYIDWL